MIFVICSIFKPQVIIVVSISLLTIVTINYLRLYFPFSIEVKNGFVIFKNPLNEDIFGLEEVDRVNRVINRFKTDNHLKVSLKNGVSYKVFIDEKGE